MTDKAYRDGRLIMDSKQELANEVLRLRDALAGVATELDAWASNDQPKYELVARMKSAAQRARASSDWRGTA